MQNTMEEKTKPKKEWISPIAIDLGYRNTGVYYTHYAAGTCINDLKNSPKNQGKVYTLDKYTLLMQDRTAKRHQRRGIKRRKLVKRLFKLIWCQHFELPWDASVQQSVSFLLNRRGYSYLSELPIVELLKALGAAKEDAQEGVFEHQELLDDLKKHPDAKPKKKKNSSEDGEQEQEEAVSEAEKKIEIEAKLIEQIQDPKLNDLYEEYTGKSLLSGARHRYEYFNEIRDALNASRETREKTTYPKYLSSFCVNLQNGAYKGLDPEKLSRLIGHLSNMELKPLRKYFKDSSYVEGDKWSALKLQYLFGKWILREWRVGEKDKDKQAGAKSDYVKLKEMWRPYILKTRSYRALKGHLDILFSDGFNFFLNKDPVYTVPPYQDNNNRRPPKCQSLILSTSYLNTRYPKWQTWLEALQGQQDGQAKLLLQDFLQDYEAQLKELKSGKGKSYFSEQASIDLSSVEKRRINSAKRGQEELKARTLQLLLDRVKLSDPFRLNEIYSQAKKWRQIQSKENQEKNAKDKLNQEKNVKGKLEEGIEKSHLPVSLKTERDYSNPALFKEASFLHFVCQYYKIRQRARDGRVFIHPEYTNPESGKKTKRGMQNTGRFQVGSHLLSYCNHKPRQKRYQLLHDITGLLQIDTKSFEEQLGLLEGDNTEQDIAASVETWLMSISGLKTNAKRAAEEQKERRGSLGFDISRVYGRIYHYTKDNHLELEKMSSKEKKEILKKALEESKTGDSLDPDDAIRIKALEKSKVDDAFGLYDFCSKACKLYSELMDKLPNNSKQKEDKKKKKETPIEIAIKAVYLLAQIHNIAFKERQGNAKTCAVCSMDNAFRMQNQKVAEVFENGSKKSQSVAKAQRLPAIATRMIDGAVMRMARIVGSAIAEDKWRQIKETLENGGKVRVPFVVESNQFEFEPSKETLVKAQRKNTRKGKTLDAKQQTKLEERLTGESQSKTGRIKKASQGLCPYTGDELKNGGELDHILPRSSELGTLNDEANLIYASREGNRDKGEKAYYLSNLSNTYKKRVFNTDSDAEIIAEIKKAIWGEDTGEFSFGKYNSFINLSEREQRAMRHALFLDRSEPLFKAVLSAINNRTRTFVNGTQRYFTEITANTLYKKAVQLVGKEKAEKQLSFDYFQVEPYTLEGNARQEAPVKNGEDTTLPSGLVNLRNVRQEAPVKNGEGNREEDAKPKGHFLAPQGVKELRANYEISIPELQAYQKTEGRSQKMYSHFIDAQMAFILALQKHKDSGGFKLSIPEGLTPFQVDIETGEYKESFYDKIRLASKSENFSEENLSRRKPHDGFNRHRSFTRDTMYAACYVPILAKKEGDAVHIKLGFTWENSVDLDPKSKDLVYIKMLCKHGFFKDIPPKSFEDFEDAKLEQRPSKNNQAAEYKQQFSSALYTWLQSLRSSEAWKQKKVYYLAIHKEKLHSYFVKYHNTNLLSHGSSSQNKAKNVPQAESTEVMSIFLKPHNTNSSSHEDSPQDEAKNYFIKYHKTNSSSHEDSPQDEAENALQAEPTEAKSAFFKFCRQLSYRTEKKAIRSAKDVEDTLAKDVEDTLAKDIQKKLRIKVKGGNLIYPAKKNWEQLWQAWQSYPKKIDSSKGPRRFEKFLSKWFAKSPNWSTVQEDWKIQFNKVDKKQASGCFEKYLTELSRKDPRENVNREKILKNWRSYSEKIDKDQESIHFNRFLSDFFRKDHQQAHQKVRGVYSLPIITGEGRILLQRKRWDQGYLYQIINDSDSRSIDNKPNIPIRNSEGERKVKLAQWAKSSHFARLNEEEYSDGESIDPSQWFLVDSSQHSLPEAIDRLWYRIDDNTAPSIAVRLAKDGEAITPDFMDEALCKHGLRKPNDKTLKEVRNEFYENSIKSHAKGTIITYKGSSYGKHIDEAFKTAKAADLS